MNNIIKLLLIMYISSRKGSRMRNSRRRDDYSDKPPVRYHVLNCLVYMITVVCSLSHYAAPVFTCYVAPTK